MNPIKKLLIALLASFILNSVVFLVISGGMKNFYLHTNSKFSTLFTDTANYDILFVGSSRTHSNIYPLIIDSITKLKSFNAGVDGANMYEFKSVIDGYLHQHTKPQYIVLNIDLFSFKIARRLFNYTNYLTYYKNKKIDRVLKENGHYSILYRVLPFLLISELDDYSKSNAIKGYFGQTDIPRGEISYKGYLSVSNKYISNDNMELSMETMVIDKEGAACLIQIIECCKVNKIKLCFTYAPEYKAMWQKRIINANETFDYINAIAERNSIPFYRYDKLGICNNPRLFFNVRHLNNEGAIAYSAIMAKDILLQ